MRNEYDVIVVGAGPAGSAAARHAALGGASVLMLEKDRDIGVPVRCAEGVSHAGLAAVVDDIDPRWIENRISRVMFYSPSGLEVELHFEQIGYIINRKLFDYDLARRAADAGAEILTKAYVCDLLKNDGRVSGVRFKSLGKTFSVAAKVVIGADGVESRVGRWAGLKTRTKLSDIETCAQFVARGVDVSNEHLHLFFSQRLAPQGYLWIFPKGDGVANVGLGISGEAGRRRPPIDYLQEFMANRFPKASILGTVIGSVPPATASGTTSRDTNR